MSPLIAKSSCQWRRHIPHKFIFKNIYLSLSTSCREVTTHNTGAVAHERLVIEAMYFFRAPPKLAKTSAKPEPSGLPRSKNTQLFKIRICQSDNCGGSIYKLEVYSLFERPKISGMSEQWFSLKGLPIQIWRASQRSPEWLYKCEWGFVRTSWVAKCINITFIMCTGPIKSTKLST